MTTNTLPSEYVSELRGLRESGQSDLFLSHIKSLRDSCWPLSTLATALDVSKTTVAKWGNKDFDTKEVETPPFYIPPTISDIEASVLAELTKKSSTVRRFTAPNSPARKAAEALESMLLDLRSKGVSVTDLAKACGVTRRAINQRLDKYRDGGD